jgi:uncharacterized protein with PQ loop repeat
MSDWKSWKDMNSFDKYMLCVALFGRTFLILQIIKIITDGSSDNVSFTAYLVYFITSLSWLIFGIYYRQTILTLSSFIGMVGGLLSLNIIMAYKSDKNSLF